MTKKQKKIRILKNILLAGAGVGAITFGLSAVWLASLKIPDFRSINERKVINSTKIYDRTGEVLLFDIHQDIRKTDIPFEEMGVHIKNATVAIEDAEFYNHRGVRMKAIIRATLKNAFSPNGKVQGGSTITQQLVKNTLLTRKKEIARKIKEWVLAVKVDRSMPKEKILEYYLNESPYGGNVYGIAEAAKVYFNKKAADLSLPEAAYLAAIPQSPTVLSPYGRNTDKLEARKNLVLRRMLETGFITEAEHNEAKNQAVEFYPQELRGIKAPHFVFFIKDQLIRKYGEETVEKGGLRVTTTLDYTLQEKGEKIVKEGALENEKNWNGKNAALVAIDPKTGQILTMVGSRDYFDMEIDGNYNVATALRQPGSSFKPFIYATAFGKGFLPETVLFDLPTEFQATCDAYGQALPGQNQEKCYMPENYDGKYRGPISLRDALAQSINMVAVKLFYLAGMQDSLRTAEEMGISTLSDISRYGLTLVIGGGEVKLLDLVSAYGVFAEGGVRNPHTGILKVEDKDGKILEEYAGSPRVVLEKEVALTISDILSDNVARTPTFGSSSALLIPGRETAAKTGTTNNNRDAWTIGYTPSLVVGVWVGNNDNTPMKKGGVAMAGPIWNKFMSAALESTPKEEFEKPSAKVNLKEIKPVLRGHWQGNERFFIDRVSGKLAAEWTPPETLEEKVITNVHTILHWVKRSDITGPPPVDPYEDPQFTRWEIPVQNWWAKNWQNYRLTTWADKPIDVDDVHTKANQPEITIIEPWNGVEYSKERAVPVKFSSMGRFPLRRADVLVNNVFIESLKPPFEFSFLPKELDGIREENELKIVVYDSIYNRAEAVTFFKVK